MMINVLEIARMATREFELTATDDIEFGTFWWFAYAGISCFLFLFAGIMSGLTLGLMSLGLVELEILQRSGTNTEKKQAAQAAGFYDYQSFITASIDFQRLGFGTTGGEKMQMKEVAAFLGHVGAKRSCGYGVVTGGPLAWGLCYNREMSPSQSYCRDGYLYPCAPGAEYYGRGALPVYCMLKTLERYRKNTTSSTSQSSEPVTFDIEDENYQDYLKLKARTEVLQQNYRNLQGEDLEPLSVKELDQLENELEVSLKQVRSTRTQYMFDHLTELQQKEQMLHKANKTLSKKKMDEDKAEIDLQLSWQAGEQRRQQQMDDHKAEIALQLSWQAGEQRRKQQMEDHKAEMTLHLSLQAAEQQSQFAHNHHFNAAASEGFLEPLECNPSLQIGNNLSNAVNMMNAIAPRKTC